MQVPSNVSNPEPQPEPEPSYKERRPVTLLATLGLIAVTGGAVAGLVYDSVVNGNPPSIAQLGTLATLGFGGLLALSGSRANGGDK